MKKCIFILLFAALAGTVSAQGFGERVLFNDGWAFNLGEVTYGGKEYMDISEWRKVTLPHDWSVEGTARPDLAACTGFLPGGIGWYRKEFEVPADRADEKVYIYFEGVYKNSEVFINGKWVGKRPNGYISFMYDLTPYIKFGENNSIAVRVDHSDYADSRWYTGSGIYRDVHLVYANPVHIDQWGVYYTTDGKNITVRTTLNADASATVSHELVDAGGKVAGHASGAVKAGGSTLKFAVDNPVLWQLDDPYLYTLKTTVKQGGKIIDRAETKVGIRTLTFDADKGFALNGKWMKLKGVCIHHDAGVLGSAVPKEVWRQRLLRLKEIGCNAIRTSHNPQAECLYELCDELGLLVDNEAFDEWEYPKKKWITGWNVGTPGFQGSADYFREWGRRDMADMVRRDRNHPSVIMWSIGNEVDYPNDPYSHPVLDQAGIGQQHTRGYQQGQPRAERLGEIARELADAVRANDTSRPVTAGLAGPVMSNETDYPKVLDVAGYNYTEDRYDADHAKYPDRILYGSENSNNWPAWKVVLDKEFIFGQFIWTGLDYLGESRGWPARGFNSGLVDFASNIKPSGYFRRALWSEEPVAYVGTSPAPAGGRRANTVSAAAPRTWNYADGQQVRVVCYTNCEQAELLLDGKVVGERKPFDSETAIIYWDIPYSPGTLEVKAYNGGREAASDKVATTGLPYALKASTESALGADNKTGMIFIDVVDSDGNVVNLADNEITCRVEGPVTLVGLESGSNDITYNYRDNVQRALNGKLLAYVRSGGETGEAKITFTSPLLQPTTIQLRITN